MPDRVQRRHSRIARQLLVVVFLLLRCGDACTLWYTQFPTNPFPFLKGLTIGSALWSTVLLAVIWQRQRWARYVLTTLNWLFLALLCFPPLLAWGQSEPASLSPYPLMLVAAGFYLAANVLLIHSRRIRHLAVV